ncbi:MAG: glycosyltransferase family 2 protein [Cyclobacteriaceae bacterium]
MAEIISVLMPVKNAGKFLAETIESIIGQSFRDWELIAIDDSSEDDSVEILQHFNQLDSRINYFQNDDQGIIAALQKGYFESRGQHITRIDADDIMPSDRLSQMVTLLKDAPPKTIVTGQVKYFGRKPISEGYLKYENWLNERCKEKDHWNWVYRECVVASPNWLVRKSELEALGGFQSLCYPEDYDLTFKLYQNGFHIHSVNDTTLLWREHPDRTSRNSSHYNQESFFRLKLDHFIKYELKDEELLLWGVGVKGKLTAQILLDQSIKFIWMAKDSAQYNSPIFGMDIKNPDLDARKKPYKILIAVYPENQVDDIIAYLSGFNLKMGTDYWFL